MSVFAFRSRKNAKFAGVLNDRLNVKRIDWLSATLNVSAARGEMNWPLITEVLSTRNAARKSQRLLSAVLPCTYAPYSSTLSTVSLPPLIVLSVCGLVWM